MQYLDNLTKGFLESSGMGDFNTGMGLDKMAGIAPIAQAFIQQSQEPQQAIGSPATGHPGSGIIELQAQGGAGPQGIQQMIGGAAGAGDLMSAAQAYQNTQNLKTRHLPGIGGAMAQIGELAFDKYKEKGAREELAKQMGLAQKSQMDKEDAMKRKRAESVLKITGNQQLSDLAYSDEKIAQHVAEQAFQADDPSTLQKEFEFVESLPEGHPERQKLLDMLSQQKTTQMNMPLEFGYMYDKDGNVVLAPGEDNPRRIEMMNEHMEMVENKWQAGMAQAQTVDKLSQNLTSMDRALKDIDWTTTGVGGKILSNIPGTDAYNLYQTLDTLKATVAFRELIEMRNASSTGGALGNVSNREIKLLYSSFTPLNEGMSADELRKSVMQMAHHYEAMRWGLANEKQFLDRVKAGEMTMEDAQRDLQRGKELAADQSMFKRTTNPDLAAKAYQDRFVNGKPTDEDFKQFEAQFGFRPKIGGNY